MESREMPFEYSVAEGPEGLWTALSHLLEKEHPDSAPPAHENYIFYKLGNQKALIKVELGTPVHFTYYDFLGRPAPQIVKETLAKFLWEKCGAKDQFTEAAREE